MYNINYLTIKTFSMKKLIALTNIIWVLMLSIVFVSCKKDENATPPMLERVRILAKDSTVVGGFRGVWYTVQGLHLATTNKVTVNDLDAYLNPTMITDNFVTFSVPLNAPFRDVPDKIKVFTKYGEALIDFKVIAPPPTLTSVAPLNVQVGDIVTVKGLNLTSAGPGDIKFGNTVVEIQPGSTDTEMKIKIPAGERFGKLNFTVNGQTATTKETISVIRVYYFKDALASNGGWGCWNGGWGNAAAGALNTTTIRQGTNSWKFPYNQTWGTYQHGMWGTVPLLSDISGQFFKMSVYVEMPVSNEVRFEIKAKNGAGTFNAAFSDVVKGGAWTEIIIPLSSLGNPDKITELQILQAAPTGGSIPNGGVNTVYFDEIGIL
jgi:hypothetical protein